MQLQTARLLVEIGEPGVYYHNSRFDWSGYVMQVTLDGRHTFCVPFSLEADDPRNERGLCNEFGIEAAIGYDEARAGEQFPKLGVGLLTKPDDTPYFFATPYAIEHFPITCAARDRSLTFTVNPLPCRGYAARLEKTLSVTDHTLTLAYLLENTGTRPFATEEYCHNFLAINEQPIGAEYQLRLPASITLPEVKEPLYLAGETLHWRQTPDYFYAKAAASGTGDGGTWELLHTRLGVGVRGTEGFSITRFALWGTKHAVSPENFVKIDMAPGERMCWTRQYEFFTREG
jgi:hypothetical protein